MRLDLPTDPNIEVWRASQANVSSLLREHRQGLRGIVGVGDDEFYIWVRSKIDHGQVAEKLGIEIQIRVDFHHELEHDYAMVRAASNRVLQHRPWFFDYESIGYPPWVREPVDFAIHEWLERRGYSYLVTSGELQIWKC